MKKIITLISMLFWINMGIYSNDVAICDKMTTNVAELISVEKDYDFSTNHEQFGKSIDFDLNDSIYDKFCKDMFIAGIIGDKRMSKNLLFSSIKNLINGMATKMDKYQFRQFIQAFNLMMYRHGFFIESGEYCDIQVK